MERRVVEHGGHVPVPVAKLQRTISHETFAKHLAIDRARLLRLGEAVREVRADEGRSRTAGQGLDGGIDVVDPAVRPDRDERIEARLEQASIVGARQPGFCSDRLRLRGAPFGQLRQLAGRDGGDEKRGERDPILRVRDRQRVDGRQEEEVEAQHADR